MVTLCLLGHHISQWLWTCYGMENWLKHRYLLEHSLIIGQEGFAVVGFCMFLVLWQAWASGIRKMLTSFIFYFTLVHGNSCTYQLTQA